jgi:amino acid transporter
MSREMVPIIIVPAFFFAIFALVKVLSDNAVRRKLIDKGMIDENVKFLYAAASNNPPAALKWGMMLIAVGAAILIGQFMPYSFQEEFTISLMLIMAGLALVVYYFIGSRIARKSEKS